MNIFEKRRQEFFTQLRNYNLSSIKSAGARFTPSQDINAPNLPIRSLLNVFAGLLRGEDFQKISTEIISDFNLAFSRLEPSLIKSIHKKIRPHNNIPQLIDNLRECSSQKVKFLLKKIVLLIEISHNACQPPLSEFNERIENEKDHVEKNRLESFRSSIYSFISTLKKVESFIKTSCSLLDKNLILLTGEWGTGKTHFLCDLAKRLTDEQYPALISLAKNFKDNDPLSDIVKATQVTDNIEKLCDEFIQHSFGGKSRPLFIIDGINEGNEETWRFVSVRIAELATVYPMIGFVLSCRTPFEELIIPKKILSKFFRLTHYGFEQEQEYEAQRDFFNFYEIPFPEYPLLTEEFSRPLTLKIICETLQNLTKKQQHEWFDGVSSGQKGMTHILEKFVLNQGKNIEKKFKLKGKCTWELLKGTKKAEGISAYMANNGTDYIPEVECKKIIASHMSQQNILLCEKIYGELIANGILVKDTLFPYSKDGSKSFEVVIRLPYQKFSDHLVARYLLETFLKTDSEKTIRYSFYISKPLGRIFEPFYGSSYKMPGLAQAIIQEFPIRVQSILPKDRMELFFYLPKSSQSFYAYQEPFIGGLFWRSKEGFSEQTYEIINHYLQFSKTSKNRMLDTLVALATKPNHPCSADSLYRNLFKWAMNERDLVWSEYLRDIYNRKSVNRLIDWVEHQIEKKITANSAYTLIVTISLFLTSTDRILRDRATRALVYLGEIYPSLLFRHTIETLNFNDPYVSERMLAASYGVGMSLAWVIEKKESFRKDFIQFSKELLSLMFMSDGKHLTWHILKLEYAVGIINLAQKISPKFISNSQLKYLTPSLRSIPSIFPLPKKINTQRVEKIVGNAIHMDFENYTIGALVRERGNYDYLNLEYQNIKLQIKWRMVNLGYDEKSFYRSDQEIMNMSYYEDKKLKNTERYGKKYSWIAYFEMYGLRKYQCLLHENIGARVSCINIDPSFPINPSSWWNPHFPEIFDLAPVSYKEWMKCGILPNYENFLHQKEINNLKEEWILLDGFIEQVDEITKRNIFTFFRGILLKSAHVKKFKEKYFNTEYPGNSAIPDPISEYNVFSGEIPWSTHYGYDVRTKRGTIKKDIARAYENYNENEIGIQVELPLRFFSSESGKSELNNVSRWKIPSPSICDYLKLVTHGRQIDFFDENGQQATIYQEGKIGTLGYYNFLYLRKDLLKKYLEIINKKIIWSVWGERNCHHSLYNANDVRGILSKMGYEHIHKQFFEIDI